MRVTTAVRAVLAWMTRPVSTETDGDRAVTPLPRTPRLTVPAEYLSLHKYLDDRYADTVVLTFGEIEDLLGFTLPERARVQQDWWANENPQSTPSAQSRSWLQASRTASPNLQAQTVVFERG